MRREQQRDMVMVVLRHTKADRDLIEEQRFFSRLPRGAQIITCKENQLICACSKLVFRQNGAIGAAIGVGDSLSNLFVAIAGDPVKRNRDPLSRAALGRVEHMGGKIAWHRRVPCLDRRLMAAVAHSDRLRAKGKVEPCRISRLYGAMSEIKAQPLSANAFAPFGDVLDCSGDPDKLINAGMCGRYHDRAALEFEGGRAGVSLFRATPRELPYALDLMERHPQGSQCFVPMSMHGFLVCVADDVGGKPGLPRAFLTAPGQAVNFHKGVWHGVLTPLHAPGRFAVIDRIGDGANLEEFAFETPYIVTG